MKRMHLVSKVISDAELPEMALVSTALMLFSLQYHRKRHVQAAGGYGRNQRRSAASAV